MIVRSVAAAAAVSAVCGGKEPRLGTRVPRSRVDGLSAGRVWSGVDRADCKAPDRDRTARRRSLAIHHVVLGAGGPPAAATQASVK